MRKLLLATTAALGASVAIAGGAYAGTLAPNAPNPAPGSISVTFNTVVEAFVFDGSDTGKVRAEQTNRGSGPAGGIKSQGYGIGNYIRLFPSFTGMLANGLQYGASSEFRHTSGFQNATNPTGPSVYVQRAFLYIGADKFGKIYLGSQVQPTELFQTGNPANFNTGGWDGDLPGIFATGLPYFIDDSQDRANKIVYVSPQFAGFDFGVSFEPDTYGNDFGGPLTTRVSSAPSLSGDAVTINNPDGTTSTVSAFTASSQYGQRRNTFDGSVRYQGAFGPLGVKANVGGSVGGTVRSSDGGPNHQTFDFLAGGLGVTYGGLEIDGHIDSGHFSSSYEPEQHGAHITTAYVVGASYTIGPVIFGGSYYGFDSGQVQERRRCGRHAARLRRRGRRHLHAGSGRLGVPRIPVWPPARERLRPDQRRGQHGGRSQGEQRRPGAGRRHRHRVQVLIGGPLRRSGLLVAATRLNGRAVGNHRPLSCLPRLAA